MHNPRSTAAEPKRVRLTGDYLDLKVGMGYRAGTVLVRLQSSQYGPEGTGLGDECVAGFFLIRDICEILER